MKNILEKLWHGNISPFTDCRSKTKEATALIAHIADLHDGLYSTLTDKQKAMLGRFDECSTALININERDIFIYAFRLGAQMAVEVMKPDK